MAILLVTPAFLGSKFCQHAEGAVLLQRARRGQLQVLPLFAEPCLWDNEPWLRRTQMWPTDGMAVSEHDGPARKRLVTDFARRVRDAVDAPATPGGNEGRFDKPHPTHHLHRMPQTGSRLFGRRQELTLLDAAWDDGDTIHMPGGLLALAEFHRTQDNLDLALRDLDEVRTIVRRTGMRLFEVDLEQTRWHLAKNDRGSARKTLDKAKDLVDSMDDGRRRPEVEAVEAERNSA